MSNVSEQEREWKYLTPGMVEEIESIFTERILLLLEGMERDGQIKPFPGNKGPRFPKPSDLTGT